LTSSLLSYFAGLPGVCGISWYWFYLAEGLINLVNVFRKLFRALYGLLAAFCC
jgi:hypothetical protein